MDRIRKINLLDGLVDYGGIKPNGLKDLYIECNALELDLITLKLYRVLSYGRLIDSLKNQCLSKGLFGIFCRTSQP